MSKAATLIRYAGSALIASAFVLFGGGWLIHRYVGHEPSQTVGLRVIRGIQLISHVPTEGSAAKSRSGPSLTGFVQVAFTVGPDGRAHGIHVVRAEPAGHYEEAAREIVAARRFKPAQGAAARLQRTEVVHFQVPASALETAAGGKGGSAGGR